VGGAAVAVGGLSAVSQWEAPAAVGVVVGFVAGDPAVADRRKAPGDFPVFSGIG
jgi:hypothetical protein